VEIPVELSGGEASFGGARMIEKAIAFDIPPPGAGLNTVTSAVPALSMSLAEMEAVNWLSLRNVVVRSDPFHRTTLQGKKFEPFTCREKPDPPADALEGKSEPKMAVGFPLLLAVFVSVKLAVAEDPNGVAITV
jgi:hypothetical protein